MKASLQPAVTREYPIDASISNSFLVDRCVNDVEKFDENPREREREREEWLGDDIAWKLQKGARWGTGG